VAWCRFEGAVAARLVHRAVPLNAVAGRGARHCGGRAAGAGGAAKLSEPRRDSSRARYAAELVTRAPPLNAVAVIHDSGLTMCGVLEALRRQTRPTPRPRGQRGRGREPQRTSSMERYAARLVTSKSFERGRGKVRATRRPRGQPGRGREAQQASSRARYAALLVTRAALLNAVAARCAQGGCTRGQRGGGREAGESTAHYAALLVTRAVPLNAVAGRCAPRGGRVDRRGRGREAQRADGRRGRGDRRSGLLSGKLPPDCMAYTDPGSRPAIAAIRAVYRQCFTK